MGRYRNRDGAVVGSIFAGFGLLWLAFWLAVLVGWIWNIVALCHSHNVFSSTTGVMVKGILRIIGIVVPPIGGVMGLFFHDNP